MAAPDFGLEPLYKLQYIDSKKNAIILLVHYVLTKNGWLYVGRGTEWKDGEIGSETFPTDWTYTDSQYRYVSRADPRKKYILSYVEHDVFILVNMVDVEQQNAQAMNINKAIHVDGAQLASNTPRLVFPRLFDLMNQITDQLVRGTQTGTRNVGTSTPGGPPDRRDRGPDIGERNEPGGRDPDANPLLYGEMPLGRRDLDPFLGPGPGGGNIIDPMRAMRDDRFPGPPLGPDGLPLPRGAVPPGARFDPFFPEGGARPDLGNNPDVPYGPYQGRFRPPRGDNLFGGGTFGGRPGFM